MLQRQNLAVFSLQLEPGHASNGTEPWGVPEEDQIV